MIVYCCRAMCVNHVQRNAQCRPTSEQPICRVRVVEELAVQHAIAVMFWDSVTNMWSIDFGWALGRQTLYLASSRDCEYTSGCIVICERCQP